MLNILIACYNESIADVPAILLSPRDDVRYIVSHQMSPDYAAAHPEFIPESPQNLAESCQLSLEPGFAPGRRDVVYSSFTGKGISQNRNHCLDVLESVLKDCDSLEDQLCLIADDDVRYGEGSPSRLIELFRENTQTDIISFRIASPQGQPQFKNYPAARQSVRKIPVYGRFWFSSIEIAFRFAPVLSGKIRFDENFGLGSERWPEGGEETVFLSDCLASGMRMEYFPEYLVTHPFESTGKRAKTVRKAQLLEAVAVRCRGRMSFAAFVGRLRVLYRRVLSACGRL